MRDDGFAGTAPLPGWRALVRQHSRGLPRLSVGGLLRGVWPGSARFTARHRLAACTAEGGGLSGTRDCPAEIWVLREARGAVSGRYEGALRGASCRFRKNGALTGTWWGLRDVAGRHDRQYLPDGLQSERKRGLADCQLLPTVFRRASTLD